MDVVEIHLGNSGLVTVIDAEDFKKTHTVGFARGLQWSGRICDLCWCPSVKNHTTYATCILSGSVELRLHRCILDVPSGILVDHIDHNGLNNRKLNLRLASGQGNSANRRKQVGECASRFKGVSKVSNSGKWSAQIRVNRRKRHLGCFESEVEAAMEYDRAAISEFGEFAALNFEKSG